VKLADRPGGSGRRSRQWPRLLPQRPQAQEGRGHINCRETLLCHSDANILRTACSSQDASSRRHIMQGELPKVGDTVPATIAGKKVGAKVGAVTDPMVNWRREDRGQGVVEVQADEV